VCVWDSQTASRQCTMNGHEKDIWWVDASPAGSYFASGGYDSCVAIWRCDPI
jgi:WD40 repeat protein